MNPGGSGSSACISQPVTEDLKLKAQAFLAATGWRGLFMIEILRDHSGTPWFVELNGRCWGSTALSRRQGLEYPAWHARLAMDHQSQIGMMPPGNPGVVCRNLGRELMHILFVLRGARSKAQTEWPSSWKACRDVLRVRRRTLSIIGGGMTERCSSQIATTHCTIICSEARIRDYGSPGRLSCTFDVVVRWKLVATTAECPIQSAWLPCADDDRT